VTWVQLSFTGLWDGFMVLLPYGTDTASYGAVLSDLHGGGPSAS